MKNFIRILALAMALVMIFSLTACFGPANSLRNPRDIPDRPNIHLVLLYVGYWGFSTQRYPEFTTRDIERMTEMGMDQFLLIHLVDVMGYRDDDGELQQIVTPEDIENMDIELTNASDEIGLIGAQDTFMRALLDRNRRDPNTTLNSLADDAIELAWRILDVNPDAQLWFTFPNTVIAPLSHLYYEPFIEHYYNRIKDEFYGEVWDNNVAGFYFAKEEVPPYHLPFNTDNMAYFDNPVVKLMRDLSRVIHADDKFFLWIPFTHQDGLAPGTERSRRLGYVANHTDIFDYVIIQPNHLFDRMVTQNLETIRQSALQNAVLNHNGDVIGGEKTSSTIVSLMVELEMKEFLGGNPPQGFSAAEVRYRFQHYVDAYRDLVGEVSFAFYAGEQTSLMHPLVFERIRVFFDEDAEVPDDYVWPEPESDTDG